MLDCLKKNIAGLIIAISLIALGVLARLLPHPVNFAPLGAVALFSGFYFSTKIAIVIPLVAMFLADLFIGFYDYQVMIAVYFSLTLTVFFASAIKKKKKIFWLSGPLFSAVVFFLITNLAVFLFTPWYSKNLAGLWQCYFLALPFFKNTLMSDFFYSFCLFGLFETICYSLKEKSLCKLVVGKN